MSGLKSPSLTLNRNYQEHLRQFVAAYSTGPSRALLRSYEANLLSQLQLEPPILDLACGDGLVSSLTIGKPVDAGCDLMLSQLQKAKARGQYESLTLADARKLPYRRASFATVISNSSIEHIPHVQSVLGEVSRILRHTGVFVFTVPNPRFTEWFWLNRVYHRLGMPARGQRAADDFNNLREHYNVCDAGTWSHKLEAAGFSSVEHCQYLPYRATFTLTLLEHLWKYNIRLSSLASTGPKQINLASAILLLLPSQIRMSIQLRLLARVSRQNRGEQGSHLLMIAKN
jgi:ubiquinone/menaquinone biosynthesis C-methylase UbiE